MFTARWPSQALHFQMIPQQPARCTCWPPPSAPAIEGKKHVCSRLYSLILFSISAGGRETPGKGGRGPGCLPVSSTQGMLRLKKESCAATSMHAHTRTHAHAHKHAHACTHMRTHAYTHTRTHARTHARTHMHARTHTQAYIHARTHARTHLVQAVSRSQQGQPVVHHLQPQRAELGQHGLQLDHHVVQPPAEQNFRSFFSQVNHLQSKGACAHTWGLNAVPDSTQAIWRAAWVNKCAAHGNESNFNNASQQPMAIEHIPHYIGPCCTPVAANRAAARGGCNHEMGATMRWVQS